MRRITATAVTFVLASVAALGTAGEASANFGSIACAGTPRNCVSVANNYIHTLRFVQLDQIFAIAESTNHSLVNHSDPTDLRAYRDDADPFPDVIVYDDDYGPNGLVAWAVCPPENSGTAGTHPYFSCRGQKIIFNSWYWFNATDYDTVAGRIKIACHEIGHTVGLRHWNPQHSGAASCMFNPAVNATIEGLSQHDRNHINAYYS